RGAAECALYALARRRKGRVCSLARPGQRRAIRCLICSLRSRRIALVAAAFLARSPTKGTGLLPRSSRTAARNPMFDLLAPLAADCSGSRCLPRSLADERDGSAPSLVQDSGAQSDV